MSDFIVSARKYRPATFESVVGQKHITDTLRNAVIKGTLAHAYLFCGPRGVGKTTCARILAKTINCMSPGPDAEPCNECESCRSFNDNRSFNIHELDAASNNSVDNIRALVEQVRIPPQVGRYSIYIIDEAHMLSTAAFNAFLKTLEEPPAHAIFILATTEKHKIIPTILSRCQIYDFKRIKADDVVEYLKFISEREGVTYDDEALHMIARKADGCMRDALSMYDKTVLFCKGNLTGHEVAEALNMLDYDTYFGFVDTVAAGDYADALLRFDEVLQKGFDSQIFLGGLCGHFRNLLVAKNASTMPLLEVSGTVAERYKKQAESVDVSFIFDAMNIATAADRDIRNSNSQRLHSELAILKMCNLSPLKLSKGSVDATYTLPVIRGAEASSAQQAQQAQQVQQVQTTAPATSARVSAPAAEKKTSVANASDTANTAGTVNTTPAAQPPVTPTPTPYAAPQQNVTTSSHTFSSAAASSVNGSSAPVTPKSFSPSEASPSGQPHGVARPTGKSSRLGLSINSMMVKSAAAKATPAENDNKETESAVCFIAPEDETTVLEGCRRYAAELMERRPRLAMAFSAAKIENGKVLLTLNSKIVEQEVMQNKHEFVKRLMDITSLDSIDIETHVDETMDEVKTIIVKDEDKLKHLSEKNPVMKQLCSELNLDFS